MTPSKTLEAFKNYPLEVDLKGRKYFIRQMESTDGDAIKKFASTIPAHDLMYMRRDISRDAGVKRWMHGIEEGRIHSLIALNADGDMVGYSTIHQDDLEWTRHVADLRVAISTTERGSGLGRLLIREAFNVALSLDVMRVTAHMTTDQIASRNLFQELGFQNEALLKDHVRDRDNQAHDLLIMACNVDTFLATRQAFGVGT
ncbi:MAG: N-acetyltransferase family protein [Gammaproteobacteria bacterium]